MALGDALGVPSAWSASRSIRSQPARRGPDGPPCPPCRRGADRTYGRRSSRDRAHQPAAGSRARRAGGDGTGTRRGRCWPAAPRDGGGVCCTSGCVPIHDPSNHDPRFVRNRVRHELLPLLDDIAGRDTVPAAGAHGGPRRARISPWLDSAGGGDRPDRRPGRRRRHAGGGSPRVRRWLAVEGYPPDAASVGRVLGGRRGRARACELPGGRRVERHRQRLRIVDGRRR